MKQVVLIATVLGSTLFSVVAAPGSFSPVATITYEAQGPVGKFRGTNKAVTGKFTWDKEAGSVKGNICVEQKAWSSGEGIRDDHTREMFEVDKFPTACFALESLDGEVGSGKVVLVGSLTMHGVTLPVKIPGTVKTDGEKLKFTGQFVTKIQAWKMNKPSLLGITVGDDVTAIISAEAVGQ